MAAGRWPDLRYRDVEPHPPGPQPGQSALHHSRHGIVPTGGVGHGEAGPWSQNLGEAVKLAKERKAKVIGFSGDKGGLLKEEADACVVIPTVNKEHITPHTEGWHTILAHLIVHRLLQMVDEYPS